MSFVSVEASRIINDSIRNIYITMNRITTQITKCDSVCVVGWRWRSLFTYLPMWAKYKHYYFSLCPQKCHFRLRQKIKINQIKKTFSFFGQQGQSVIFSFKTKQPLFFFQLRFQIDFCYLFLFIGKYCFNKVEVFDQEVNMYKCPVEKSQPREEPNLWPGQKHQVLLSSRTHRSLEG